MILSIYIYICINRFSIIGEESVMILIYLVESETNRIIISIHIKRSLNRI